jgi:hypothetical protein
MVTRVGAVDDVGAALDELATATDVLLTWDLVRHSTPVFAAFRREVRGLGRTIGAARAASPPTAATMEQLERRLTRLERLAFGGPGLVALIRWPKTLPGRLDLACELTPDEIADLDEARTVRLLRDLRIWNTYLGRSPAADVLDRPELLDRREP